MPGILPKLQIPSKKTNEQRRLETTEKIIDSTIALFREQGYERTTMRQIAQKAGILNGSLYNIFDSKEDIFKTIITRGYESTLMISEKLLADNDNITVALAFPLALDLHLSCENHRTAELMHEAHSSWMIVNSLIDITMGWMEKYLEKYSICTDTESMRYNLIAILGSIGNFVDKIYYEGGSDYSREMKTTLEMFCTLFRIPAFDLDTIVEKIVAILKDNKIVFTGTEIIGDDIAL